MDIDKRKQGKKKTLSQAGARCAWRDRIYKKNARTDDQNKKKQIILHTSTLRGHWQLGDISCCYSSFSRWNTSASQPASLPDDGPSDEERHGNTNTGYDLIIGMCSIRALMSLLLKNNIGQSIWKCTCSDTPQSATLAQEKHRKQASQTMPKDRRKIIFLHDFCILVNKSVNGDWKSSIVSE